MIQELSFLILTTTGCLPCNGKFPDHLLIHQQLKLPSKQSDQCLHLLETDDCKICHTSHQCSQCSRLTGTWIEGTLHSPTLLAYISEH